MLDTKVYDAMQRAAARIERGDYDFGNNRVEGHNACIMGTIGHELGFARGTLIDRVMEKVGFSYAHILHVGVDRNGRLSELVALPHNNRAVGHAIRLFSLQRFPHLAGRVPEAKDPPRPNVFARWRPEWLKARVASREEMLAEYDSLPVE